MTALLHFHPLLLPGNMSIEGLKSKTATKMTLLDEEADANGKCGKPKKNERNKESERNFDLVL